MPENLAPIEPARTALLLMDFQPAALATLADSEALLARANQALAWARKTHVQACFVRVGFTLADYESIPLHSKPGPAAWSSSARAARPSGSS